MELTEQNIQDLYKFTRQHYVEHYDLQTELVDHLANDIEEIWKENPNLSFEKARDKSFKKFGIFGFMDVVEKKQKQMHKRYWKIIWRFASEWFEVPKIILTISIFLGFLVLINLPFAREIFLIAILAFAAYSTFVSFKYKRWRENKIKKEKVFLLEDMIGHTKSNFTMLTLLNVFNCLNVSHFSLIDLSIYWQIAIALFGTLLVITSYITSTVIPEKAEELLIETYPEYKIVNSL